MLTLFLSLSFSLPAWAVCSFSGIRNQEGSLKHDGTNFFRCDSGNSWENLGTLSGADNLGNHTATQNLLLGSYFLSGDGGNEGVYVDATGNVGIGTTSPLSVANVTSLTLNGTNSGLLEIQSSGSQKGAIWYDTDHLKIRAAGASGRLVFDTDSAERMRITESGNIGVGTTNPSQKLDVNGNMNVTGSVAGLSNSIEYKTCTGSGIANSDSCTASCSAGYVVIGGGCEVAGGGIYNQVYATKPTPSHLGWYCQVTVDWDHGATMTAAGYAICIKQ